jgi:hypothetical protein
VKDGKLDPDYQAGQVATAAVIAVVVAFEVVPELALGAAIRWLRSSGGRAATAGTGGGVVTGAVTLGKQPAAQQGCKAGVSGCAGRLPPVPSTDLGGEGTQRFGVISSGSPAGPRIVIATRDLAKVLAKDPAKPSLNTHLDIAVHKFGGRVAGERWFGFFYHDGDIIVSDSSAMDQRDLQLTAADAPLIRDAIMGAGLTFVNIWLVGIGGPAVKIN